MAAASVERETGNKDILGGDGPGWRHWLWAWNAPLGPDDLMDVPDWWSSIAARQMGTSPVLEDTSDSHVPVGVAVSGPDLPNPGLGVMLGQQDDLSKTVPGPGYFFPESGCSSTGPAFVNAFCRATGGPSAASGAPERAPPEPGGPMRSPGRLCTSSGKFSP